MLRDGEPQGETRGRINRLRAKDRSKRAASESGPYNFKNNDVGEREEMPQEKGGGAATGPRG